MATNCFGIPDAYFGFRILQAYDDDFYATPEGEEFSFCDLSAPSWDDLREMIHGTIESNASGNPEWEAVSKRINAARAAIAKTRKFTDDVL